MASNTNVKNVVDAFLELLPPATRELIVATAEKHDYERFGPGQGVVNAVVFTFNVAQHRTLSGYEIASMAAATMPNFSDREIKKKRKEIKLSAELDVYDALVNAANARHVTISYVFNNIARASWLYERHGLGDKLRPPNREK